MFWHGKKGLGKKDRKGWRCDKILVHLKKFTPVDYTIDFIIIKFVRFLMSPTLGVESKLF